MSLLHTSTFELEVTKNGKHHDFEVDFNPPSSLAGKSAFMKLKNVHLENVEGNHTNTNSKPIPVLLSVKNLPQPVSTLSQTETGCRESRLLGCFKTNLEKQPNVSSVVLKFPPKAVPANNLYTNVIVGEPYGNETYITGPFNSTVWNGSTSGVIEPGGYDPVTGMYPNTTTDKRYIFKTNEGTLYGQSAMMYHTNKRRFVYARDYYVGGWGNALMEMYILGSNDYGGTYDVLGVGYGDDYLYSKWNIINSNSNSTKKYNLFAAVVTKTQAVTEDLFRTNFRWYELEMYFEMEIPALPRTIKKFPPSSIDTSSMSTVKVNNQSYGNENYTFLDFQKAFNGLFDVTSVNPYDPTTGLGANPNHVTVTNIGLLYGQAIRIQHENQRKLKYIRNYTNPTWINPPMEIYITGSNNSFRTNDVLGVGYGDESFPGGWKIIDCDTSKAYTHFSMVVTKVPIGRTDWHAVELEMYFEDYVTQRYPPQGLQGFNTNITTAAYGNGAYQITTSEGTSLSWQLFNDVWFSDLYFTGPAYTVWDQTTGDYTGPTTTLATDNNTYPGAWVQLQLPVPILLTTVTLVRVYSFSAPSRFLVMGSNDGNSWDILFHQFSVASYNPFNYFSVDPKTYTFYSYFRIVAYQISLPHPTCNLGEILLYGAEMPQLHTESNHTFVAAPSLLTVVPYGPTTLQFSADQLHPEQLEEAFTSNTRLFAEIEFEANES